jgi:hypothetical protein
MHYVSLYTHKDIGLEEVALCAMKAGFKTYYIAQTNARIGVEYTLDEDGEPRVITLQVWKPDIAKLAQSEPPLLAGREPELIEMLQPTAVFTIAYRAYSLPKLMILMKGLLNTFGGWMISHDTFDVLTEADIDSFMKV